MDWNIEFFDKTVEASIKEWPVAIIPEFLWLLNLIEKMGPDKMDTPYIKSLGDGLFKINTRSHRNIGCTLFCISEKDKTIIILDGFITTTHKTSPHETTLARIRMNEINLKEFDIHVSENSYSLSEN